MMHHLKNFIIRGMMAASGGPMILGIIYYFSGAANLSGQEVFQGILTSSILAFIAAGLSIVYQIERLPLLTATLIHCGFLFADYLFFYLLNDWLQTADIIRFLFVFFGIYAVIWCAVMVCIRHSVRRVNQRLPKERE